MSPPGMPVVQHKRRHTPAEVEAALAHACELYSAHPNAVYEAALAYSQIGWPIIPSPLAGENESVGKNPVLDGWQNRRIAKMQVPLHFQGQVVNVGVLTGSISRLIDFNIECEEAVNLAEECLPPTGTVFGHPSAPRSHWLYQCIEVTPKPTREFKDPLTNEEPILELRGDGGYQTILPGSLHVLSGEWVEWSTPPQQPACIPYIELHKRAVRLATRVMLTRYPSGDSQPDEVDDPLVKQRLELWQSWQEEVENAPADAFKQAQSFLNALDDRTDRFTFQTFDDDRERKDKKLARKELIRVLHGTLAENYQQLLQLSQTGAGIFVTINATNFKGRSRDSITEVRAYFADLDGAPLNNLKRLKLPPHIITETSPGRYGAYWLIADAPLDAKKFKETQQRLARYLESDSSICDLPRLMRLPGFPHQKEPSSNPFMTRIVSLAAADAYPDQEFQRALPNYITRSAMRDEAAHMQGHVGSRTRTATAPATPLDGASAGKPPVDLAKGYEEGERNTECARVAGSLLGKGRSEEEALAECLKWNELNDPPMDEEEVRGVVHSIAKSERRKREGQRQETQQPHEDYEFKWDGDVPAAPAKMLIKKLIPATGIGFIGGQPSAGKTFITLKLAVALASSAAFFDYPIKERVGVLYITGEGVEDFPNRIAATKSDAGIKEAIPFVWTSYMPDIQTNEGRTAFTTELRSLKEEMQRRFNIRLGAIIIDTVGAFFVIKDENSNAEINRICQIVRRIGNDIGCLMLLVHHFGKNPETGLRGAQAWNGSSDVTIAVLANINQLTGVISERSLSLVKTRAGAQGPLLAFTLETIRLGVDEDGDEIRTCVAKIDTNPRLPPMQRSGKGPGKIEGAFRAACRLAFDESNVSWKGKRLAKLDDIKNKFFALYPVRAYSPTKKNETLRRAWTRATHLLPEGWSIEKDPDGIEWLNPSPLERGWRPNPSPPEGTWRPGSGPPEGTEWLKPT
jgi:hypothetical protein